MKVAKGTLLELYTVMLRIRLFEERIVDLYARGLVPGMGMSLQRVQSSNRWR